MGKCKKAILHCLVLILVVSLFVSCGGNTGNNLEETTDKVISSDLNGVENDHASRLFIDSVGRQVKIPKKISKIAITGPLAQIGVFAIAPEMLIGIAVPWDEEASLYLPTEYYELPVIGQLYGGKGEMNLEELLGSGAELVIDLGEPKDSIVDDLDSLQEQTGIPFVHITATLETSGEAYRILGELLGKEEEGEERAQFLEEIYSASINLISKVNKKDLIYLSGEDGLNVIAQTAFPAEILDLLMNNIAIVDEPSSKGTGNEVTLEQIFEWNPENIIFGHNSIYATVKEKPQWQGIEAINNDSYYEVPYGPHDWMGRPQATQRYLGMMWLSELFYPDDIEYNFKEKVQEYYSLFYHTELTDEQYISLIENSLEEK